MRKMETAVHRNDYQKNQSNGPRVSFNRDVHVKRIGTRPNEKSSSKIETTNLQPPNTHHLRRELPADLTEESIRKEAAHVLAQAEKIKCKAQSGKNNSSQIKYFNNKKSLSNKFHSLPIRKKKVVEKPITRSVSDVSSKKLKKPSILQIFSRSNELLNEDRKSGASNPFLGRSKSDASSYKEFRSLKKKPLEKEDLVIGNGNTAQLSPIIENTQKEQYFENYFNSERRKSEAITANEKSATKLKDFLTKYNTEPKLSGNIGYTNHEDLDFVPSKPITETIQTLRENKTKSLKDMHSSQVPTRKPALTKGLTVNGMVKRLSMERFSPPPMIAGPAFSYTRPNENIIYAQLAEDEKRSTAFSIPQRRNQFYTETEKKPQDVFDYPYDNQIEKEAPLRVIISSEREIIPPVVGPTMIRIEKSSSPWQQLSGRNLSDDEGLGTETRKYFDDEYQIQQNYEQNFQNNTTPSIGNLTPPHMRPPTKFDEINTLSRRRANLESRIRSRNFIPTESNSKPYYSPPENYRTHEEYEQADNSEFHIPTQDEGERFHILRPLEILNKYSPERSHLDLISPGTRSDLRSQHSLRYFENKYHNISGINKEIYEREEKIDDRGKPTIRESRIREQYDSNEMPIENIFVPNEYEPKSWDSSNTKDMRCPSPEYLKNKGLASQINSTKTENWQSLKRDKRNQKSFDKGDSGIENDFRKDNINERGNSKWRKRTIKDDITVCELFIKKERRHTEIQHPQCKKLDFVYRERSIDDGSHYDPRLDKYPQSTTSTLRRNGKTNNSTLTSSSHSYQKEDTLKRNKKVGSFQKVKLLFTGNRKKERETIKENDESTLDYNDLQDKYMVKEEEMRSRYREHRSSHQNDLREPKITDISLRRRLSTPKASPLLKRISPETPRRNSTKKPMKEKPEHNLWFKSIERKSRSKSSVEKLDDSILAENGTTSEIKNKTLRTLQNAPPPIPPKNFRFFGDTDLDSNPPTISKAATTRRSRPSDSVLNRAQKYSQSAFHLDRINQKPQPILSNRIRSSSLQNLDEGGYDETDTRKRRHYSRSRNLDDISESGSETEERYRRQTLSPVNNNKSYDKENHSCSPRNDDREIFEIRKTNLQTTPRRVTELPNVVDRYKQNANVLPKPLRNAERRFQLREQERLPDSSGTEGESSMQSQRSIIYLHATTVGEIPVPYQSNTQRRRTKSRENVQKNTLQPMTRSVSRSVSMLAPWKPKFISEGYEINYSQKQNGNEKKLLTLPRHTTTSNLSTNTSTLKRNKKPEPSIRLKRQTSTAKSKEDLSFRKSTSKSAPNSNPSSMIDSRKESLRRK